MSKFGNPLNNLRIASPCSADWNQMVGNNRQRHCGDCKLNVYNLSGMTRHEAEDLIMNSEGRVCMRIYKRPDGTVLTKDCPVGWQAVKQRVSKVATAFASMIFAVLGGIGLTSYFADSEDVGTTMGAIAVTNYNPPINDNHPTMGEIEPMMGDVSFDEETMPEYEMGKIAPPDYPIAGGIENIEELKREIKKTRK